MCPHDSSQSDVLVRKHINGLAITFFIPIAPSLLAAILGYAISIRYWRYSDSSFMHSKEARWSWLFWLRQTHGRATGKKLEVDCEFGADSGSVDGLLRGWATNNLDKITDAQLPGKCGFHVAGIQFKVPLCSTNRLVERKANLSASKQSFSNRAFTRLAQGNLP